MAQLLPAERQACESRELLSLNASISRTLLTIEPECHLACQLREIQIDICLHVLAALVEEKTADTTQGPNRHGTSLEDILPHPDIILPSIDEELPCDSIRLSSLIVGDIPGETPEQNRRPTAGTEFAMAKKRPKRWLCASTRGFFT
ncbi:hypothetical protein F52700_8710 [Fusarium sp. NRRL 52700]|nr:hypothetical protein F52700_8710 [Fusarium sp. NRRL 52700]